MNIYNLDFEQEEMIMADRTKAEFELWIEEGARYLSNVEVKENMNIYFRKSQQLDDMPSDKQEKILSKVKMDIAHTCFEDISIVIVNNLEVIYATNPNIQPEDAIKIAFMAGMLKDHYSEADLHLALISCYKARS